MVDVGASKGVNGDRAVTRLVGNVAPVAPAAPAASVRTPDTGADVARLSGVAAQIAAKPPIDENRIAEIKKALANGTFPILPATIADRLLAVRYDWMSHDKA